jgi:2-enoate reductase
VPEFKKDLRRLLEWYERQMMLLGIDIHLNSEVNPSRIGEMDYDVAVLATGSAPCLPAIPGIERTFVTNCCEVLAGRRQVGENVILLGGGLEGCETALWLAQQGKSVSIVEMTEHLAIDIHYANRQMLLDMIHDSGIKILMRSKAVEAKDGGIVVEDDRLDRQFMACDTLVSAVGLTSVNELRETLSDGERPFHLIGDCKKPRNVHHAILEGFNVGHYV